MNLTQQVSHALRDPSPYWVAALASVCVPFVWKCWLDPSKETT